MDGGSRGATWLPDDTIVFATNTPMGLQRVAAAGGMAAPLTKPSHERGEAAHYWPQALPGGRAVLFTILPAAGDLDAADVAVLDLTTGAQRILVHGGSDAHYVASGHLVYATPGALQAVAFDLARLAVRGTPVPVLPSIVTTANGGADVATGLDGTFVFVNPPAGYAPEAQVLAWVDREGHEQILSTPPHWYVHPRLSRDGTRVALTRLDQSQGIWIWDVARRTLTRVTSGPGTDHFPVWTPDERRIVFSSSRAAAAYNLYWQSADGTATAERLTESANSQYPTGVTPDGAQVLFTERTSTSGRDVMLLTLTSPRRVIPLLHSPFNESNAVVSPDGRWLAYQSDASGRFEVYVRPFPDVDAGQWQVSTDGGGQPLWSRSGSELFYARGDGGLMAVPVTAHGDRWSAALPMAVVQGGTYGPLSVGRTYDVSADGRQFLALKLTSGDATGAPQIVVVTHWDEELKRLVPVK
jgi:serine/threonine-protein kinase